MVFNEERRNLMQIKTPCFEKEVYGYEMTSDHLAKGSLIDLGGCTAQSSPLLCLPAGRAGRGKEKPTCRTPQLLTPPPGEGDPAARPMQTLSSLLGLLQRMTIYCPF